MKPDRAAWPDARLVRDCVQGSEDAWSALLDKYKNLIYSIPLKQGLTRDAADDVFQRVCMLLMAQLRQLKTAEALPMWIIRITARESQRWRRREFAHGGHADIDGQGEIEDEGALPEELLAQLREEQAVRDAVSGLPDRCRELVRMLFFQDPPRSYGEVAQALGLAGGSVPFLRARCLGRLRKALQKARR